MTTLFWKDALASLPPSVQRRHAASFEAAERLEALLDLGIEAWGSVTVHLTKKPRAEAPRVIVDSHLKIESKRAAYGAGQLPVGDSVGISGRRTLIPEGLELCHCSHDRFPK